MMKLVLIVLQLSIVSFSAFSLYGLWSEMIHVQPEKSAAGTLNLPKLAAPQTISVAAGRTLFDVVAQDAASSEKNTRDGESVMADTDKKNNKFQIKGIFVSASDRFALLEPVITKGDSSELLKVTEGGGVDNYKVSAIETHTVRLLDSSSGESVRLKAFSRNGSEMDLFNDSMGPLSKPADKLKNMLP